MKSNFSGHLYVFVVWESSSQEFFFAFGRLLFVQNDFTVLRNSTFCEGQRKRR